MTLSDAVARIFFAPRDPEVRTPFSGEEIEGWVEAAGNDSFQQADSEFVQRAMGLGVNSGMVLDLDSPLGLVALKILWNEEGLLGMGVYRSLEMAERARETAEDWGLGQRMFFQVGDARGLRFKTGYFDMVISDGVLHTAPNPLDLLKEVERVTKPGGAILIGQRRRPSRFGLRRTVRAEAPAYPESIRNRLETTLRSGYTRRELMDLVRASGLDRARIVREGQRLFIERPGSNDPASWVSERERYL